MFDFCRIRGPKHCKKAFLKVSLVTIDDPFFVPNEVYLCRCPRLAWASAWLASTWFTGSPTSSTSMSRRLMFFLSNGSRFYNVEGKLNVLDLKSFTPIVFFFNFLTAHWKIMFSGYNRNTRIGKGYNRNTRIGKECFFLLKSSKLLWFLLQHFWYIYSIIYCILFIYP